MFLCVCVCVSVCDCVHMFACVCLFVCFSMHRAPQMCLIIWGIGIKSDSLQLMIALPFLEVTVKYCTAFNLN